MAAIFSGTHQRALPHGAHMAIGSLICKKRCGQTMAEAEQQTVLRRAGAETRQAPLARARKRIGENGARFIAALLSTNYVELISVLSGRVPSRPASSSAEKHYGPSQQFPEP
jgi:hypothetical protein